MMILFPSSPGRTIFVLLILSLGGTKGDVIAPDDPPDPAIVARGEALSRAYCAICHLYPEPSLLDRFTWQRAVLPAMAPGGSRHTPILSTGSVSLEPEDPLLAGLQKAPPLPPEDFAAIVAFYAATAPETLPPPPEPTTSGTARFPFRLEIPDDTTPDPGTSAIRIDPVNRRILVGSTGPDRLDIYDDQLLSLDSAPLPGPPTAIEFFPGQDGNRRLALLQAGEMDPHNTAHGSLHVGAWDPVARTWGPLKQVLNKLRRPVAVGIADFLGQGFQDIVVGEFGDALGRLASYRLEQSRWDRQYLIPRSGCVSVKIRDLDKDGHPDIIALMTQGREGVYFLRNDGKGGFTTIPLVEHPPSYGSSSLELADLNGDGRIDLIVTCGDNADYSEIYKPYHGVYVYLQGEDGRFEQAFFHPIHGAYQVMARDFDLDGDIDLAVVGFFSDFIGRPQDSFVYLENLGVPGKLEFAVGGFPETNLGRWILIDAGDVDGDGDEDIVLGNFLVRSMNPGPIPEDIAKGWADARPRFVLLRNETR